MTPVCSVFIKLFSSYIASAVYWEIYLFQTTFWKPRCWLWASAAMWFTNYRFVLMGSWTGVANKMASECNIVIKGCDVWQTEQLTYIVHKGRRSRECLISASTVWALDLSIGALMRDPKIDLSIQGLILISHNFKHIYVWSNITMPGCVLTLVFIDSRAFILIRKLSKLIRLMMSDAIILAVKLPVWIYIQPTVDLTPTYHHYVSFFLELTLLQVSQSLTSKY